MRQLMDRETGPADKPVLDDPIKIGIVAVGHPPAEGQLSNTMYYGNFPRPFQHEVTSPRAREMYEIERNMREADVSFRAARKARRVTRRHRSAKRG